MFQRIANQSTLDGKAGIGWAGYLGTEIEMTMNLRSARGHFAPVFGVEPLFFAGALRVLTCAACGL